MDLVPDERSSDSPFIERVWQSRSEQSGEFISMAVNYWQMVVTRRKGIIRITMRGPETKATRAYGPDAAEFFGILFKFGTYMPSLPARSLVDCDVDLPDAARNSFWLNGSTWEIPNYENAETFVKRLVQEGLLVHEPVVTAAIQGQVTDLSQRTAQRRFLQATGLTLTGMRQVERARHATMLLKQGTSILDTVFEAGYFDQPHLTRALKHYIGQTPAQIMDEAREERLSFLYNTDPLE